MTQPREHEPTAAGAPAAAAGPPSGDAARNGITPNGFADPSLWAELCAVFGPTTRAAWLQLADAEGVLYTHRLPAGGSLPKPDLLSELLAGRLDALPQVPAAASITPADSELDHQQRDAVRQALISPDLFLIQGAPGTGKSRLVTELITQAARRGQTVLFLAPHRAAIDPVLEKLTDREGLLPLRCLGAQERAEDLPLSVQRLTFDAQARHVAGESVAQADARSRLTNEQIETLARDREVLIHLRHVADQWQDLENQRGDLLARRQRMAEHVASETHSGSPATSLGAHLVAESARHAQARAQFDGKSKAAEQDCHAKSQEHQRWACQVQKQQQLLDARRQRRFLSIRFWRALLQGRAEERLVEFQCREVETRVALGKAESELADIQSQSEMENQRHGTAEAQIIQQETARRQADADQRIDQLAGGQREVELAWEEQRRRLVRSDQIPTAPDVAAVQHAYLEAERQRQAGERQLQFLTQWRETLRELAPRLPERLLESANVIAACANDIGTDPHFGDRGAAQRQFDLVILEQAERFSEPELLAHARRGVCCVLVGQTPISEGLRTGPEAASRLRTFSPFHRLWNTLHCDPRRLPYQWLEEPNRISCRLIGVGQDQPGRMETEHLDDHPDVELRILSRPNLAPALAEVVFPAPKFTISAAKAYLYQHLGELTLRPAAAGLRWRTNGELLLLDATAGSQSLVGESGVELEVGVREVIHRLIPPAGVNGRAPTHWGTARIEFDLAKGWDRQRAETWLRDRAGLRNSGRTALLETQWRTAHELSLFYQGVLDEGGVAGLRRSRSFGIEELQEPVQFIAVPYPRDRHRHRPRGPQRPIPTPAKSFEIDLSDPRQRQRLPLDLQLKLPQKGVVNFAEAQAIIHLLDLLVRAPGLGGNEAVSIAVLSWQQPQVHFLESLWSTTAAQHEHIQVGFETAAGYREREADIVLVSLCRSNSQRAIGYTDYPEEWRWALTAARSHLVLFGDLDTLARRSQSQSPVSRQSEAAAAMERTITGLLVRHFDNIHRRAAASPSART